MAPSQETHNGNRTPAKNTYKWGFSTGANLRYWLTDSFSIQTEVLYATRGSRVELNGDLFDGFSFSYLEVPLLARYRWLGGDAGPLPLSGYVIAGPAVSYLLGAEDTEDGEAIPRGDLNSIDVSLVAGIGGTYRFHSSLSASVEVRYDHGFIDAFADLDNLETKNRAILLTLSVDYVLSDRDSDRDGLADYRDRCPTESAGPDQDQDRPGCPAEDEPRVVDKDDDGIVDDKDSCPEEPEDNFGFEDTDGCPDGGKDADQDGLANADDKCPNEHFSRNSSLKHESIKDKKPKQENPGCPILRVDKEGIRLVLDPSLEFNPGQDKVQAPQEWILDEVVMYLNANPGIELRVEGYADRDLHGAGQNLQESTKRAESVREYLKKRVRTERKLTAEGRGSTDSDTEEGKRKSRRVEFIITGGL